MRRWIAMIGLVLIILLAGCGALTAPTPTPAGPAAGLPAGASADGEKKTYAAPPTMTIDPSKAYTAVLTTTEGSITIDLLASEAPITVNNFVFLANEGFYNGTIFHRVIKGFMIQGGDPTGTGSGSPGYRFNDEPVKRDYTRGIVAMANGGPNTNGSQFFIMQADRPLQPDYTIFGEVTSGMETVDAIAGAPVTASATREMSKPVEPARITNVEITVK